MLNQVAVSIAPGSIHGLLGQNGSGKSTLIKVLAGFHAPDPGANFLMDGKAVSARRGHGVEGLAFVHQDLGLFDKMPVLENLAIGRYRKRGGRVDWRRERHSSHELLERFDVRCSPDDDVADLSEVQRALVAIARAVDGIERRGTPGLLILDEPTVYLPKDGVDRLFTTMRTVADGGTSVLFVSHQLSEVKTITDRVTVLRGGVVTADATTESADEATLVEWIVGRPVSDVYAAHPAPQRKKPVIRATGLSGDLVSNIDLTIHEGEIVGVTGLVGSGYEEIPYLLYGATKACTGQIEFAGRTQRAARMSPQRSIQRGMVLVPGNRGRQSVAAPLTVASNVEGPVLRQHSRWGLVRGSVLRSYVQRLLTAYDVRPPYPDQKMGTLSGGNQQKAVVAKWLQISPRVLLLHEPTQGVDVEARADVFKIVADAVANGAAALLASSEFEDIAQVCDRVLVFRNGELAEQLDGPGLSADLLADASYRQRTGKASA